MSRIYSKLRRTSMSKITIADLSQFTVTNKAMRPASNREQCFYCQQKIGDKHKSDCVLVKKKVKVRTTVEHYVSVPNYWGEDNVNFQRNDSSYCLDNVVEELREHVVFMDDRLEALPDEGEDLDDGFDIGCFCGSGTSYFVSDVCGSTHLEE